MKISYGAKISISVCFFLLICSTLFASTLRISWNNNTEPDLAGYRIYCGSVSGAYGYVLDVGDNVCVDIDGVEEGTVYFFAVTAYDLVGNESDFSREISVLIPENQTGFLSAIVNWILDLVGVGADDGADARQCSLADFVEEGGYIPVNTSSTVRIDDSDVELAGAFTVGDSIIKDVVAEAYEGYDLSRIYPSGTYTFVSLTELVPAIIDGVVSVSQPGVYQFMVQDMAGDFINILRISVVNELCYEEEYLPGTGTSLPIDFVGISLFLPENALNSPVPVGIDCGGASSSALSALSMNDMYRVVFNIVPYGLVLAEPAQISVPYGGPGPIEVEVFDEATKQWTRIEDVNVQDGVVTFSTTMLGSFKVSTPSPETNDDGFSYGSSGSGGGCFIESLQGIRSATHRSSACMLLAMIVLGATLRAVSSIKRS